MLAKGLRTHSVYDYCGYRLSYIKTVYKHRNIPLQVKDGSRLLIKTAVFIQHLVVKEIPPHGLYSMWKTFSLLYSPSTVNALCHDAAYDSCGPSSCVPHTDQHPPGKPTNRTQCWLSFRPCYKKVVFLPTKPTIWGGFLLSFRLAPLLSALLFPVRRHSLTLQCRAELHFDHQAVVDW